MVTINEVCQLIDNLPSNIYSLSMFQGKSAEKRINDSDNSAVLPSEIRFAIKYKEEKQLDRSNVESLFANNFSRLGLYLSMKATSDNDEAQAALLHQIAERQFKIEEFGKDDVSDALDSMKEHGRVTSSKLGLISMFGFQYWVDRFDHTLSNAVKPGTQLFMLANGPFSGIDILAKHSLERGEPLGILKPNRFDEPDLSVGYLLKPTSHGTTIEQLPNDFVRPENALIFDDITRTGSTMKHTSEYWLRQADTAPPFVFNLKVAENRS